MSIIINNNIAEVYYQGNEIEMIYVGSQLAWEKPIGTFLATGQLINNAISKLATSFVRSSTPPDSSVTTIDISENVDGSVVTWYDDTSHVQNWYSKANTISMNPDSSNLFAGCPNLITIELDGLDSNNTQNMSGLFNGCSSLSSITYGKKFVHPVITSILTSNDENMTYEMFKGCNANKPTWDEGEWNNDGTFIGYALLAPGPTLNSFSISSSATSFIRSLNAPESSVEIIDLSLNLDESIISWMDGTTQYWYSRAENIFMYASSKEMFWGKSKLTSIDISGWNSSQVQSMSLFFRGCEALTSVTYGDNFTNTALSNISVSDYNNSTYEMFYNCPANKPIWTGGTWLKNGTFVKDV